jgi:parallel beta-helix repeat protein
MQHRTLPHELEGCDARAAGRSQWGRAALCARATLVALGGSLVLAGAAVAADYWVKNGGSDAANGLSQATAWATLVHAADVVAPGDTVHVLDGSYRGFYLETSGTSSAPITFRAEGSNARITQDNPTTPDGINLEGASWVVIDGFEVNDRTRAGIRAVLADHVTVRNCRLGHNGRWGILTGYVDDFTAEGNEAHHSVAEHGIYVSNSCDRPIVRNNVVYSNHANGLHFNGDAEIGGGDGLIQNALVEGNVIYDNGSGGGSGINMDGGQNGVIRNNLLYGNHSSGISLYRIDGAAGAKNNLIINNTIVQASDARWAINIRDASTGNTVRNNILWNAHPSRGVIAIDASSRSGFSSDYNSVMSRFSSDGDSTVISLATWQGLGYDTHSFVATPADNFVTPGSDFHLLSTSPAVDAGTSSNAPATDLDGEPRPVGAAVDMGAYELQLESCGNGTVDPGEECEDDGDCSGGATCSGCACHAGLTCSSGITVTKPMLVLRAAPSAVTFVGQAIIPKPWSGIDPPANGVRFVIDDATGDTALDVTLPGGAAWTANPAGTRWVYRDPSGLVAGIRRVMVTDKSSMTSGLVAWRVSGRGGALALPDVGSVRSAMLLGDASECALTQWNGPTGAAPRCIGGPSRVKCK